MFLPVIFIRSLGVWGWIAFTIPNVIGAAAMGWVFAKPGRSETIVHEHLAACSAFSAVTIAYHIYFVLWFIPRLVGLPMATIVFALAAIYLLATAVRAGSDLFAGVIVWVFSLTMLGLFLHRAPHVAIPLTGTNGPLDLAWLAPLCVFGFALNPYLDLTFHRARQAVDAPQARVAFGIGFGICFFAMLVFTLLYATTLMPLLSPEWRNHLRPALGIIVAAHMILQAAFTIAVHTRSFVTVELKGGAILALLVLGQLAVFLGLAANLLPSYHGRDAGEVIYLLFMAFYSVVFPAYVWLCMVPGRDGKSGVSPAKIRSLVLTTVVVTPMLWMAFVENHMGWILPGLAVLVMSRFAVPGNPKYVSPRRHGDTEARSTIR
jgi:hypothetical protein